MLRFQLKNTIKFAFVFMTLTPVFSNAAIVSRTNVALSCEEYEVIYSDPDQKRDFLAEALSKGAQLVSETATMGLSLRNLRIDFTSGKVLLDVRQHILLGFNRNILTDVTLSSTNPMLQEYVNRLNYDFFLSRSVCVNADRELIEIR